MVTVSGHIRQNIRCPLFPLGVLGLSPVEIDHDVRLFLFNKRNILTNNIRFSIHCRECEYPVVPVNVEPIVVILNCPHWLSGDWRIDCGLRSTPGETQIDERYDEADTQGETLD